MARGKLITDKICRFSGFRNGPPKQPFCKMTLIKKFTLCPHSDGEHFLWCRGSRTAAANKNTSFWPTRVQPESRVAWNQSWARLGLLGAVRERARASTALVSSWPGGQGQRARVCQGKPTARQRVGFRITPELLEKVSITAMDRQRAARSARTRSNRNTRRSVYQPSPLGSLCITPSQGLVPETGREGGSAHLFSLDVLSIQLPLLTCHWNKAHVAQGACVSRTGSRKRSKSVTSDWFGSWVTSFKIKETQISVLFSHKTPETLKVFGSPSRAL